MVDFLEVVGIPSADGRLPKVHGGGSNRIFFVGEGNELILKNLELTGGKVDVTSGENGGALAIKQVGCLRLYNCALTKNTAGHGGVIFINGGTILSINTTYTKNIANSMNKTPIIVKDSPGFATSRLGVVLGNEAIRMLADGVASAKDIDTAMVLGYKHPMGPLALSDLVGLDVRRDILKNLQESFSDDSYAPHPLLEKLVQENRLGRKTGVGIYDWTSGEASETELPEF